MLDVSYRTRSEVSLAIQSHILEFAMDQGQLEGVQLFHGEGFETLITGIPFPPMNLVILTDDAQCVLQRDAFRDAVLAMKATRLPFMVWDFLGTMDLDHPALNGIRLIEGPPLKGMVAKTGDAADPILPREFTIRIVEDPASLKIWLETFQEVYSYPTAGIWLFRSLYEQSKRSLTCPWELYVLEVDGQPVGCTSNFFSQTCSGIYCQGTVESARRQGIGSALVRFAMFRSRQRGYLSSVLLATPDGFPVYRRSGFKEYSLVRIFVGE